MNKNMERIGNVVRGHLGRLLALCILMGSVLGAMAVTKEEMEKARVIAAKNYIRYANNMSGYLDEANPQSMTELEALLKNETDKKSFQQFKSCPIPSDYPSWDKEKLVEYWSQTFFNENRSNLNAMAANNGEAKLKIKRAIQAMKVSPPRRNTKNPKNRGSKKR